MTIRLFYCAAILLLLMACQSTPLVKLEPKSHLYDYFFPNYQSVSVESVEQIIRIDASVREYLDREILSIDSPEKRMDVFSRKIFAPDSMHLSYKNNATTTASDTFRNREANCLSLSILAYAMANYAGFTVFFQDVDVPEYWELREGYGVLNGHINLLVLTEPVKGERLSSRSGITIDFNGGLINSRFDKTLVPITRIAAMYYNNKGAEALIAHHETQAYAYFRAAMLIDPEFLPTWGNMGVLYRIAGKGEQAELLYRSALVYNPDNKSLLENLAVYLRLTDRVSEADKINKKVDRWRRENAFYHFYLGEIEYGKSNWKAAKFHYHKAIKLSYNMDVFYFGLAKTYYKLGDIRRSGKYLRLAKRYSADQKTTQRYVNKLTRLNKFIAAQAATL